MPFIGNDEIFFFLLILYLLCLLPRQIQTGIACLSNPCVHGICLDDWNSTYFCYCIDGYTGIQCQTNWNECWSSPCKNNGTCIDGIASFNCSCPPGFVGDLCEEDFNECESNPCINGGSCLDNTNGYVCNCIQGYSGVHCEIDIAVCNATNETRCANGGVCVEGPGMNFTCNCQPGWKGGFCETEIDECASAPCQNGAVCMDLLADYFCACSFGYSGRNCEDAVKICDTNPCSNGALCLLENGHSVCYCVPDFHGDLCQFQYDECQLGPKCLNGGTCIDGVDNSTCKCPAKFTGVRCECLILDNNELDCTYISPSIPTSTVFTTLTTEEPTFTTTTFITSTTSSTMTVPETLPTTETTTSESPEISTITTINETSTFPLTSTSEYSYPVTLQELTSSLSTEMTELKTDSTTVPTTTEISDFTTTTTEIVTETETDTPTTTITTTTTKEVSEFPITSTTNFWTSPETTTGLTTLITSTELPSSEGRESNASLPEETTIMATSITTFFTTEPDITTRQIDPYTDFTSDATSTLIVPFDCSKTSNYCQNGGSCLFDSDRGYECVCPFDTEGKFCEVLLGVQKAAFIGDSYLVHRLPSTVNISLQFEAKTLVNDGLWIYATIDGSYMALFTENGYLKFKFSCGYQTMLLSEVKIPVNTGFLMRVQAKLEFSKDLKHCDASIKVNDTLSMRGDQISVLNQFEKPTAWLYLGNLPQSIMRDDALPNKGFTGCLMNLKISGKSIDIFKDAEDGFGVTECSSLACLANPCSNGATCYTKGDSWGCSCKNGFLGAMCEISVCDDNPCMFGGTCIPFSGSGYICLCPFGKHGHYCENDIKIKEPHFSATIRGLSSFVAYPVPDAISHSIEFKFRFVPSTMDQISILMFIGQKGNHDFYSDHIAVSFVKGYIMLTWNLGSGPRRIFTSEPIKPYVKDYLIHIGRFGRRAWLYVENLGNVTGRSPGNLAKLDVVPLIYLGGHDSQNFSTLPHDLPLHTGFSGCIFDVQFISDNVIIPLQGSRQTIGRAVGQCGTTECYEQSCQNKGACLHHASTFMCLCQDGWFGPLCSFKGNPCDTNSNNCSAGSTCVPGMSDYDCDCPLGKLGRFCEKDEEISDVGFTGKRSYLSLNIKNVENNHFNVELEMRPLNDNGLIFFAGRKGNSFVSLSLENGLLELKVLNDENKISSNEPVTVPNTKLLIKGIWYKIQFGVFGKRAYLSIDNIINSKVLSSDKGFYFSNEIIYLGGLPDLSLLPALATSSLPTPFTGCIRRFFFNSNQIPLTQRNIGSARNVNDCDGTPCGKDSCLNGGTCWLDSFMTPHCSCPPPYYGSKCEIVPTCDEKMCKNIGKCVNRTCSCTVGFEGAFCENEIAVTTPEFTGKSYMIVKNRNDKKRNVSPTELKRLYLNFTTIQMDGLLLWNRQGGNSFFGLGIERGSLKIVYSQNNENVVNLPSYYPVSDGLWHSLELDLIPFSMKIDGKIIPNKGKKQRKLITNSTISLSNLLYIGGVNFMKKSIWAETNGTFSNAYKGCIEGFAINDDKIIKDFSNLEGQNINVCSIL